MKSNIVLLVFLMFYGLGNAQEHDMSEDYQTPDDPKVRKNLKDWQDLKFGLMMHWGTYSQWGIVESWSICPEDEDWIKRDSTHGDTYFEYLKNYEALQTTFNPIDFDPEKWAKAAKQAGMKYVVFTTKHHDGFAMFDTQQSDYKITSDKTPFSQNEKADVTEEIFKTFRQSGFKIGAYFSKPDWHSNYYWWDYFPPKDRNVNYDPQKHPDRWEKFKQYTYNQIDEITSNYGDIDILWLDGGWVAPNPDTDSEEDGTGHFDQDIDMDRIGAMARDNQPGIIVVDRTVPGKWENYVTPEQTVPDKPLSIPWETVMSMGDSFSYVPDDNYKSAQKIIETLIKVVSRGGNYLLNIAPGPKGDYDKVAYERLKAIAGWMAINDSAIYGTRNASPYQDDNYYYTKSKDGKTINVFHINEDEDSYQAPSQLRFKVPDDFTPESLNVLGLSQSIDWEQEGDEIVVTLPEKRKQLDYATVIQMK